MADETEIFWCEFWVRRRRWEVVLVHPDHPGLANRSYLGLTMFDDHKILVSYNQENRMIRETWAHEMLHVCGGWEKDPLHRAAHESFISAAEKNLVAVLGRFGLRAPRIPRRALRARKALRQ